VTEPENQPVRYDVSGGVATIMLDRPEAMNSLNVATKVALRDAVTAAAEDPAVRCVVLTGTGRAFCVGQDLKVPHRS
jgi:2-(1,2-epoxy-1,2-dihydrophenyl)acetyl-CoA isomerase